jgi:hypothetical protein
LRSAWRVAIGHWEACCCSRRRRPWGVFLAIRSPLGNSVLAASVARSSGHRLAVELLLLTLLAAAAGVVAAPLGPHLTRIAIAGAVLVLLGATALVAWFGPIRLAERVVDRFRAAPPATPADLNRRMLSVSSNWRSDYWRVAIGMVRRKPVPGEGGGSYERWWLEERPVASHVRNAHDLYLETLAELGPPGLILLLAALAAPLVGLGRARGHPLAPAALAAYVAWLVHAVFDWDWQIPAVTLMALAAGVSLLVMGRSERRTLRLGTVPRAVLIAPVVLLLAVALALHVGERALASAQADLSADKPAAAALEARRAHEWMPWAAQPWQLLGEARYAQRRDAAARASLLQAVSADPANWSAWYDLAMVTSGGQHRSALQQARGLNPLAPELAGLR